MPQTSTIVETDGGGDSSNKAWVFLFFPKKQKAGGRPLERQVFQPAAADEERGEPLGPAAL